jgi:hypothetical protein
MKPVSMNEDTTRVARWFLGAGIVIGYLAGSAQVLLFWWMS